MFVVSGGVLLGQGRGNESVAQGAGTGDAVASTGDEDGQGTGDGGEDGHSKGLPFAEHATHPDLNRVVHPGGLFHLGGQSTETVEGLGDRPVRGRVVGDERAALLTEWRRHPPSQPGACPGPHDSGRPSGKWQPIG